MDYRITVGGYQLAFLESVEIHKSVDLLADTCTITLPACAGNKPLANETGTRAEDLIKRGDAVQVQLGYDGDSKVRAGVALFMYSLLNRVNNAKNGTFGF